MTILNADFTLCISVCTGFKSFFRESKLQFYFLIFSKKCQFHGNFANHEGEITVPQHSVEITEIYSHSILAKIS